MLRVDTEVLYQGVTSVIGWDIDGVFCPTSKVEKSLNRLAPSLIPWIQTVFQSPRGPFVNRRQVTSYRFLSRRTVNDAAVDALLYSHEQSKFLLANSGITVRNAIYTERPSPAKDIIFYQLAERLRAKNSPMEVGDLIEGYFDNPLGNDHRQVKPNAAKELENLGIRFYLIEDKRKTAVRVKTAAPLTKVYFVVDSKGGNGFCTRNVLIPVYSPRQFVDLAFEDIRKMHQGIK